MVALRRFRRKKALAPQSSDGSTDESLDDLIKELTEAAGKLGLNVGRSEGKTKYGAQKIVPGIPRMAWRQARHAIQGLLRAHGGKGLQIDDGERECVVYWYSIQ